MGYLSKTKQSNCLYIPTKAAMFVPAKFWLFPALIIIEADKFYCFWCHIITQRKFYYLVLLLLLLLEIKHNSFITTLTSNKCSSIIVLLSFYY